MVSVICVLGLGLGDALGHHEGDVGGRLAERAQHQAVGLPKLHDEGFGVRRLQLCDEAYELLAHAVARTPALQRGDAVLGGDRRPSCHSSPSRSVKVQVSLSSLTVHLSTICGWTCRFAVEREQRVVDHHAVVGADQRRGPDRIDNLEIRVQRHFKRRLGDHGRRRRQARRQRRQAERAHAREALAHKSHVVILRR